MRKIAPDKLPVEAVEEQAKALFDSLSEILKLRLRDRHGWVVHESENEYAIEAVNGSVTCCLEIEPVLELEPVLGLEPVVGGGLDRMVSINVYMTSTSKERGVADKYRSGVAERTQHTIAVVSGLGLGVLGMVFEVSFLRRTFEYVPSPFLVVFGWLGCGFVGYLIGSKIGKFFDKQKFDMTFDEEVNVEVFKSDWESFIDAASPVVDQFSASFESVPSSPAID
ncbi:MAG: hypothetical protein AAFX93_04015 [Verrucomicrobiota bacterium]